MISFCYTCVDLKGTCFDACSRNTIWPREPGTNSKLRQPLHTTGSRGSFAKQKKFIGTISFLLVKRCTRKCEENGELKGGGKPYKYCVCDFYGLAHVRGKWCWYDILEVRERSSCQLARANARTGSRPAVSSSRYCH